MIYPSILKDEAIVPPLRNAIYLVLNMLRLNLPDVGEGSIDEEESAFKAPSSERRSC
jgi:hypothetical protein